MIITPDVTLPEEVLQNHIGVVGKTGSGKTSTAKLLIERLAAEGARVCVLDPIKSDWWGLTSSADGQSPGLPFSILGGPKGHVPLHADAGEPLGRIVAGGSLPLSIIDMADFEPGDHARFFIAFAKSLFRHAAGVVYLVVEEAHIFAPKERAGIGEETKSIHWMSKLASAARSKGIRLVVCTQRTQKLHNDVLGSCETLIVHRLTLPADQKPVIDWLKGNTNAKIAKEIAASLSSLKTGEGWICSGEANFVRRVQFPRISTYDNSCTPTGDTAAAEVRTAAVDLDRLRSIVGEAVASAEEHDVKRLRAKVKDLKDQLAKALRTPVSVPPEDVQQLRRDLENERELRIATEEDLAVCTRAIHDVREIIDRIRDSGSLGDDPVDRDTELVTLAPRRLRLARVPEAVKTAAANGELVKPAAQPEGTDVRDIGTSGLTGPQQRLVDALAWWETVGIPEPTRTQAGWIAGYTASSGTFRTLLSEAKKLDLIEYCGTGQITLLATGKGRASWPGGPGTLKELHDRIRERLTGPQLKLFNALVDGAAGHEVRRTTVAEIAGYEATSGTFRTLLSECRGLGLLVYPSKQTVQASRLLFPEGLQ